MVCAKGAYIQMDHHNYASKCNVDIVGLITKISIRKNVPMCRIKFVYTKIKTISYGRHVWVIFAHGDISG